MAAVLKERARDARVEEERLLVKRAASERFPADQLQLRCSMPITGVLRLDYSYHPAPGDIDFPGSFSNPVIYRVVPGLTFATAQSGQLSPEVEADFVEAVKWLTDQDAAYSGLHNTWT